MKIPFTAMIRFNQSNGYSAEMAHEMLSRMHTDPTFNQTFAIFWEAHPGPDEVFTPEVSNMVNLAGHCVCCSMRNNHHDAGIEKLT